MIKRRHILCVVLVAACGAPQALPVPDRAPVVEQAPSEDEGSQWSIRTSEEPWVLETSLKRTVKVAPLTSEKHVTGAYLVQMEGFNNELDGIVFLAFKTPYPRPHSSDGFSFGISLRGAPKHILVQTVHTGWNLWQNGWHLEVNDDPALAVDAEAMLALHRDQLASGVLEAIAPTTREGRMAALTKSMSEVATSLKNECGLSFSVDWKSVEDNWFDEFDIGHECVRGLSGVELFCQDHPHRLADIERLGALHCHFEGLPTKAKSSLRLSSNALTFVPGIREEQSTHLPGSLRAEMQTLFAEDDQVLKQADNYIVVRRVGENSKVFYGKKDALLPQTIRGTGWDPHRNKIDLWAASIDATLRRDAGKWQVVCDEQTTPYKTLSGTEREQFLASAVFGKEPAWKYEPDFLGRDSSGVYYYVDKLREEFGGAHHRVFVGRRGQAKLTKLVGLVEDSQGLLFSTKKGDLRLIVDQNGAKAEATWIRGKKSSTLTSVPISRNTKLIYQSLGAYFGEAFGDVCGG